MNPIILLVDVASPERENWKALLENQNFDVVTADNAESARQICLRLQPDLVLLDDHLPQVRGAELSRRLKQDPLHQLTAVVLISSRLTSAELIEGHEAGAADFWETPPSPGDGPGHIESRLRLKSYMDEQAKSVILSVAQH